MWFNWLCPAWFGYSSQAYFGALERRGECGHMPPTPTTTITARDGRWVIEGSLRLRTLFSLSAWGGSVQGRGSKAKTPPRTWQCAGAPQGPRIRGYPSKGGEAAQAPWRPWRVEAPAQSRLLRQQPWRDKEDPVQREIHQDWADREYIEVITSSIKENRRLSQLIRSAGEQGRLGREGKPAEGGALRSFEGESWVP